MDDKMKLLLNKFKSEKKKKNKNFAKIKQLDIELVKIKYSNNPDELQNALKELKRIHVLDRNLHEIKIETTGDYGGKIEMVGKLSIGDQIRETHFRFRNITDYERYINSIDEGYEAEDSIFNGFIQKIKTPQFN